jgi:uridylate kinase
MSCCRHELGVELAVVIGGGNYFRGQMAEAWGIGTHITSNGQALDFEHAVVTGPARRSSGSRRMVSP